MLRTTLLRTVARSRLALQPCLRFSDSANLESGHNRWSKIKHDKGQNDRRRSKERTGLILSLIRASRDGEPDLKMNPSLAFAVNAAKKAQISKEAIETAIAKGQGKSLSGAALDNVFLEAMLPYGVAAIIEAQTDNKTRVLADVKSIVQRAGGSLSPSSFCFEKKGKIWFKPHETIGVDQAMDEAIEAGAEEILQDEGQLVVDTAPEMLSAVSQKMQSSLGLEVDRRAIMYEPKQETMAQVNEEQATNIQAILDQLDDLEHDQLEIYINADL